MYWNNYYNFTKHKIYETIYRRSILKNQENLNVQKVISYV